MKPVLAVAIAVVLAATAQAQTQLEIKFLDEVKPLAVGKDIRFEVYAQTASGKSKMQIDQLEFAQEPAGWAQITTGDDATTGVITVKKLVSGGGIFDETEYSLKAYIKGEGTGRIKSKSRFRMETGLCLVPLNLSYSWDGAIWKGFDAATLGQLDARKNFSVSDPAVLQVVKLEGNFYAKWIAESAKPVEVTVTFPNGEKASLTLEFHGGTKAAETAPPPADTAGGDFGGDIEKTLKELEDTLDLLSSYEGKSFMLADAKRKWIVEGIKRTKRMIGDYKGDKRGDYADRHNAVCDRAYEARIRYREAGSAGNVPAKELEILSGHERDVMIVK